MSFKHLGIEKEMIEEFSSIPKTDFQILEDSDYFKHPNVTAREGGEYVEIEVISCKSDMWWYKNLIGFTFFCKIKYRTHRYGDIIRREITEFTGVKLTNNKEIVFRSFDPADVSII